MKGLERAGVRFRRMGRGLVRGLGALGGEVLGVELGVEEAEEEQREEGVQELGSPPRRRCFHQRILVWKKRKRVKELSIRRINA
jgi:hypothetical protein